MKRISPLVLAWAMAAEAAQTAFNRMCQGGMGVMLYYQPTATLVDGGLKVVGMYDEPLPPWMPVDPRPMPMSMTVEQLTRWVYERITTLPILPRERS